MATSKTGGSLKGIFDPAKKAAAAAVMEPEHTPTGAKVPAARNRKAGGRSVRISGYIPEQLDEALRDEVIRRTVADRRSVSFNDVLCAILTEWHQARRAEG
jgi:hypothetical protein